MSIVKKMFCLIALLCTISACSSDIFIVHNGNMPSNDRISLLQKGQSKEQVRELLGSPSSINPLDDNTWIYMSSDIKKVAFFKPEELKRDVLTIKFDDKDIVKSVSRYSKENGKDIEISEDATDFDETNKSLLKEYLGGVGAYMPFPTGNKK